MFDRKSTSLFFAVILTALAATMAESGAYPDPAYGYIRGGLLTMGFGLAFFGTRRMTLAITVFFLSLTLGALSLPLGVGWRTLLLIAGAYLQVFIFWKPTPRPPPLHPMAPR